MSEKTHKSTDTNLDLHNLDAVLNAFIAATQDRATARAEVYEDFHRRLIACTGSLAAAVFSKRADSQFTMISQSGWRELNPSSLAEVKQAIKQIYAGDNRTKTPQVATFVGRTAPINGVEFLYVLVRPRETDPLVEQLLEDLTVEIVNQIEIYVMRRA
jgi:hypothetical protein